MLQSSAGQIQGEWVAIQPLYKLLESLVIVCPLISAVGAEELDRRRFPQKWQQNKLAAIWDCGLIPG
jgi:hypothetical protein